MYINDIKRLDIDNGTTTSTTSNTDNNRSCTDLANVKTAELISRPFKACDFRLTFDDAPFGEEGTLSSQRHNAAVAALHDSPPPPPPPSTSTPPRYSLTSTAPPLQQAGRRGKVNRFVVFNDMESSDEDDDISDDDEDTNPPTISSLTLGVSKSRTPSSRSNVAATTVVLTPKHDVDTSARAPPGLELSSKVYDNVCRSPFLSTAALIQLFTPPPACHAPAIVPLLSPMTLMTPSLVPRITRATPRKLDLVTPQEDVEASTSVSEASASEAAVVSPKEDKPPTAWAIPTENAITSEEQRLTYSHIRVYPVSRGI